MAVPSNTTETYSSTLIRENLQNALVNINPADHIFMNAIGSRNITNTLFEWGKVTLASAGANRQIEGDDLSNTASTLPVRLSNYSQISSKVTQTSSTSSATQSNPDAIGHAMQLSLKLAELKRDMEKMLLDNVAGSAGSSGNARSTAGLGAFIRSNVQAGGSATVPTLSGTTAGYPNQARGDGSDRTLVEDMIQNALKATWEAGSTATMVMCPAPQKVLISGFTGNSQKYSVAMNNPKQLTNAIDIYVGDFGQVDIVPSRYMPAKTIYVIDPQHIKMAYLQETKQEPLAKTGLSERSMISCEYGLQVDAEEALAVIADVNDS
ncbi:MAG: hypothetical protein CMD09_03215 [Flavobacteriales bacterium]|nr:hypothetical protein [Flavobacteriales bacterium]|tara:strand:- start:1186 stop:2151 length:966 start_codon:yes stop_codon:yes gene_type:complete